MERKLVYFMKLYVLFLIAGAISFVLFLLETLRRNTFTGTIKKTITSFFFIAVAASAAYAAGSYGSILVPFVIMGLVMGMLGDIWLDLKNVFLDATDFFTFSGFISFGIGHIFFILGMILEFYKKGHALAIIIPIVLSIIVSIVNICLEKVMNLRYGSFKGAVVIYGALLFTTVLMALSLSILNGFSEPSLLWIFAGGVLFAASDLILSGIYFGNRQGKPIHTVMNLLTYYLGQYLIALSLLFT